MDVFNKLYSSVSNTVSQLSGVLPGNPVTREFEATQCIASAGPGLLWKVYKGYKKSTKQEASIFVFEKKILEKCTKADRDIILESMKRAIVQLTKLRHPQILTVQQSLEESRDILAFATEPVFASLANILGDTENMPQPVPSHMANYTLYEVEIKYGLMQLAEGLSFLHNDVKLLHHNISPESIVVNQQGAWKIFGFDFCIANQSGVGVPPFWPFVEYCPAMHHLTQPALDFLAPEYVLSASHSLASDIYSLGMLIYTLHSPGHKPLGNVGNDYAKFKKFAIDIKNLQESKLLCVAEGLREYVKLMLNTTSQLRPDLHQFLKIPYFEDVGVKTLNYLDSLFQWDNLQKSQFYKGLPQIIQKLPRRVGVYRVLPCLSQEFANPPMVPFVLPNVLLIAETATQEEYIKYILPVLKPAMKVQEPIQILLIFMQKMELLLRLTPAEEVKSDILPMLYRALESDSQQIQELCLSVLPTFAGLIDYPAMKNALLPRIKNLCVLSSCVSVKVLCLICIGSLMEHLDKWLVLDEVLPFLQQIPSRDPAVIMGISGIYKLALTHKKLGITKEVLATRVLPFLVPLCVEPGLSLAQFQAVMGLVRQMLAALEAEQRAKLAQLSSIQTEARAMEHALSPDVLVAAPQTALGREVTVTPVTAVTPVVTDSALPAIRGLSLEDKQRIAMQQEMSKRIQSPPLLTTVQTKTQAKPMDLTSTLLQSNLSQLSKPTANQYTPTMTNSSLNHQYTPNMASNIGNTSQHTPKSPDASFSSAGTPDYTGPSCSNSPALPPANLNNKWANNNQSGLKQDWSAFESLLPTQSSNNSPKTPSDDMMDFLN